MIYEVWDTGTSNQIGSFATVAAAEALVWDVLRVNGPDVARELVVLAYSGSADDEDPRLVLEGAEVVRRSMARA